MIAVTVDLITLPEPVFLTFICLFKLPELNATPWVFITKFGEFAVMVTESPLQTKQTFLVLIALPLPILFSDLLPSMAVISVNLFPLILLLARYWILILSFDSVVPFSIVVVAITTGKVFSILAGMYICHEFLLTRLYCYSWINVSNTNWYVPPFGWHYFFF